MTARFLFLLTLVWSLSLSAPLSAGANYADASGTVVANDRFNSRKEWGAPLELSRAGEIVRVMDGTYGFRIKDMSGAVIAEFLDPQEAVGTVLGAGTYRLEPFLCEKHRHHHVKVSVKY